MTNETWDSRRFAGEGGEFEINSHPIFLLTRDGETEVLVFDATLTVHTQSPTLSRGAKRQVDVHVTEWVAKAHSTLLDRDLTLRLEGDQPPSRVTSRGFGDDSDFPADLRFGMRWAVEVDGERLVDQLESVATGQISSFPPKSNDRFDIVGKDLEVAGIRLESLVCAC